MGRYGEGSKETLDALDRHDLEAIVEFLSENCTIDVPSGPDTGRERFVGRSEVCKGLPPALRGSRTSHTVAIGNASPATGGVSVWLLAGPTRSGTPIRVRGCDLWGLRDGKVVTKDSHWKIVEPPPSGR